MVNVSKFHVNLCFSHSRVSFFDHRAYCKHVKKSNHKDSSLSAQIEREEKFPVPAKRQAGNEPDLLSVCLSTYLSIHSSD